MDYPGRPSVSTRYLKVDKGDRKIKVKEVPQESLPPPAVLALEMVQRN